VIWFYEKYFTTYMKLLKWENKTTNDFVLANIDIPSFKSKIKPQITIKVKNIIFNYLSI